MYSKSATHGGNVYVHTTYQVSLEALLALDVLEAELADVDNGFGCKLLWVGGEIPGLHPEPSQLNHGNVLDACHNVISPMARPAA